MTTGALVQMNASDDPGHNLAVLQGYIASAAKQGADFVLTPEVSNCLSVSRARQSAVLSHQDDDLTLAALRDAAKTHGLWVLIGSLGIKTDDPDGRFANRSFLISPDGAIVAHYDKIHMFDVDVSPTETWRESEGYRPGTQAVVAQTPFGGIGMAICYDMRFPLLANALAQGGAQILTYPSAFTPATGAAHWHSLLRARAIETGCFVMAPAQTGLHPSTSDKTRSTYGHSLVVSPWGEVILDAGTDPGVYVFEFDMNNVADARAKVPALQNERSFNGP